MQKSGKQRLRSLSASVISIITVFAMTAQSAAEFVPVQEDETVASGQPASEQKNEDTPAEDNEENGEDASLEEVAEPEAPLVDSDDASDFQITNGVLIKYNGSSPLVKVPDTVTEVGANAFARNTSIVKVSLPASVTKIGANAFNSCKNLVTIALTSNVSEVGEGAFQSSGLSGILIDENEDNSGSADHRLQLPDKVTVIEKNVFSGVSATNIVIGKNITEIRENAFANCKDLTNVKFECLDITTIKDGAFSSCSKITDIDIPDEMVKLTSLGKNVFKSCTSLAVVHLPDMITQIGDSTFNGCTKLVRVDLPDELKEISISLFQGCSLLPEITIPNKVERINSSAFSNCSALAKVNSVNTLPASVTSIGASAFSNCKSLVTFTVPNTIETIEKSCFSGCTGLMSVKLSDKLTYLAVSLFNGCTSLDNVVIPESVITLQKSVFEGCSSLSAISLHSGIISAGESCFKNCKSLSNVAIAQSVTALGTSCFEGCASLKEISLSNEMMTISASLFKDCILLSSVHLPNNLSFIGSNAFLNTHSLATIDLSNTKLTKINLAAFHGSGLVTVEVPSFITEIDEGGFSKCTKLESISLPSTLTSIGINAFQNCSSLEQITIPDSVSFIGARGFAECSVLKSIKIPEAVTIVSDFLLYKCSNITKVELSSQTISIGASAFEDCSLLEEIELPNSVTEIKKKAFKSCIMLNGIEIPSQIENIDIETFSGCTNLKKVILPSGLKTISEKAFEKCSSLAELSLPDGLVSISNYAFQETGLTYIDTKDIISLGTGCFKNCKELRGIRFSENNSMLVIPASCCEGCVSLTDAFVPPNITRIMEKAFYGCESLANVIIAHIMNRIDSQAFANCTNLVAALIPKTVQAIYGNVFSNCPNLEIYYTGNESEWGQLTKNINTGYTGSPVYDNNITKETITVDLVDLHLIKTEYFIGEEMKPEDFNGQKNIKVTKTTYIYNDSNITETKITSETYAINFDNVSGFDSTAEGNKWIIVKFHCDEDGKDYALRYQISISKEDAVSMAVSKNPDRMVYALDTDKPLDLTGGELTLTYADGKTETISMTGNKNLSASGFYVTKEGKVTITLILTQRKSNITSTFDIEVRRPDVTGIEMSKLPTKTAYYLGETINLSGAKLKVSKDLSGEKYDEFIDVNEEMISGFDTNAEGTKTLTVTYSYIAPGGESQTKTTTFDIQVIKKITNIEWDTEPTKKEYYVGDEIDVENAKISVTFEGDVEPTPIPVTAEMIEGFNSEKAGTVTPKVKYGDKTLNWPFSITIKAPVAESISIAKLPDKTNYSKGQTLDLTGGQISVTYDNGTVKTIDMADSMLKSTFDPDKEGTQTVTLEYGGKTVSFTVEVAIVTDKVAVKRSDRDGVEEFDNLEKAMISILFARCECTVFVGKEQSIRKLNLPNYADVTINALGNAKIIMSDTKINTKTNVTINCPINISGNKPITLKISKAGTSVNILKPCDIAVITGNKFNTVNIGADNTVTSITKVADLNVINGAKLTVNTKGVIKTVDKITGELIMSKNSSAVINNVDDAILSLVKYDDPKKGLVLPKVTVSGSNGKMTVKVVDEKGAPVKITSGTQILTAAKTNDVTANIAIDPECGVEFGAVQYGKLIKAEYMHLLEMGGKDYSSLEKAFESASGSCVINLKDNVSVPKLVLPKTLSSLTINGGDNNYSIFAEAAVSVAPKYAVTLKNLGITAKKGTSELAITFNASTNDLTLDNVKFSGKTVTVKGGKSNTVNIAGVTGISNLTGFNLAKLSGDISIDKTINVPFIELDATAVLNVVAGQKITIKNNLKGAEGSKIKFTGNFKPVTVSGTFSGNIAIEGTVSSKQIFAVNKNLSVDDLNKVFDLSAISATAKLNNNKGKVMVV